MPIKQRRKTRIIYRRQRQEFSIGGLLNTTIGIATIVGGIVTVVWGVADIRSDVKVVTSEVKAQAEPDREHQRHVKSVAR